MVKCKGKMEKKKFSNYYWFAFFFFCMGMLGSWNIVNIELHTLIFKNWVGHSSHCLYLAVPFFSFLYWFYLFFSITVQKADSAKLFFALSITKIANNILLSNKKGEVLEKDWRSPHTWHWYSQGRYYLHYGLKSRNMYNWDLDKWKYLKTKLAYNNWNGFTCLGHHFLQLKDLCTPEIKWVKTKLVPFILHHWEKAGLLGWANMH